MAALPAEFELKMKELLGEEYESYLESFRAERVYGLRVNTLKISVEDFLKICPFEVKPVPWTHNGFYYRGSDKPAKHPYYFAGLYYLQEPSAMTPAEILPVEEGEYSILLSSDNFNFGGFGRVATAKVYSAKKNDNGKVGFQLYLPSRTAVRLKQKQA